jgi:Protein of unknown function (DUF2939)
MLDRVQFVVRRCIWLSLAVVASYVASPYLAAFLLHSAIKRGDTSYIQPRVDWDQVRISLKDSIGVRLAEHSAQQTADGLFDALKQDVVATFAPYVVNYVIDSKVTAEGFVEYLKPKDAPVPAPVAAEATQASALPSQGRWFWPARAEAAELSVTLRPFMPNTDMLRRIDRAKFTGLTTFEIDVRDKKDDTRRYRATFELMHYQWQLARVDVLSLGTTPM